jgi:hypothetical protein
MTINWFRAKKKRPSFIATRSVRRYILGICPFITIAGKANIEIQNVDNFKIFTLSSTAGMIPEIFVSSIIRKGTCGCN